uniref:Uncharacterized protein n=2 Tax=Haptolina ericina TaxID=156174 RepID=A0A7S3B2I9_9EUKA
MSPSKAAQVLEAYSAIASNAPVASSTEKPQLDVSGISNEIAAQQGGFWDVFVMGKMWRCHPHQQTLHNALVSSVHPAHSYPSPHLLLSHGSFSYAVYCIDYVELAGEYWTVLICKAGLPSNPCPSHAPQPISSDPAIPHGRHPPSEYALPHTLKESIDPSGNDCGEHGLSLYSNGTLTALAQSLFSPTHDFYNHYQLGDQARQSHMDAAAKLLSMIDPQKVNSSLANWIRVRAEDLWPSDYWNVLVEKSPGNSYFFCDEQLHFADFASNFRFAIFDRQCQSPVNQERVVRHARPRHAIRHSGSGPSLRITFQTT